MLRTVRRLDERTETREVNGFQIERGIPLPPRALKRQAPLHGALLALEPGDSLTHTTSAKGQRAAIKTSHRDRSYAARKIDGGKAWRIWRTK